MKKHGDRAAVRTAYKYFVLDFHRFPLEVSILRMSYDYCSFRIFHSQGKSQKSKSIVLVKSIVSFEINRLKKGLSLLPW